MIPVGILQAFVGDVWTLVEVGAADGLDTVAYARACPTATIWAFEPLLRNVAAFTRTVYADDKTRMAPCALLLPVALSDYDGMSVFYESGGTPRLAPTEWPYSSSLLPPTGHLTVHPWCHFTETHVPVRRFDSIIRPFAYDGLFPDDERAIDFVHLDVQGAELTVLRGMGSWLARTRAVWMEVARVELYKGQPLVGDVATFMKENGFTLKYDTCGEISGDQLWVRQ